MYEEQAVRDGITRKQSFSIGKRVIRFDKVIVVSTGLLSCGSEEMSHRFGLIGCGAMSIFGIVLCMVFCL